MQNNNKTKKPMFIPPTYFFFCVGIIVSTAFLPNFPIPFLYPLVAPYFGGACLAFGIGLVTWVWDMMRNNKTSYVYNTPSKILINKAFKFSRNPMYLGFILILVGGAFCVNNIFALIAPVMMFIVLDRVFIPYEETIMHKTFGNDFLKYKKRTRRWL
jgi:protein-S-isoprenylcysteine O-methyltransferase Ste14